MGATNAAARAETVRANRRRAWLALLLVLVVLTAAVGYEILYLWNLAPGAERSFIETNADCVRCHSDMIARVSDPSVHQPFVMGDCRTCHTPHAASQYSVAGTLKRIGAAGIRGWFDGVLISVMTRWFPVAWRPPVLRANAATGTAAAGDALSSELTSPADKLCWTCHGDMGGELSRGVVHSPFGNGGCTSCHDPHSSKVTTLLTAEPSTLCVSCHRVGPELLEAVVHDPFGEQACLSCHTAHASDTPGMLVANQRELCTGCHGSLLRAIGAKNQHEPLATGQCTGCHRAHSGSRPALLVDSAPALCYRCHDNVRESFAMTVNHPLKCARCHDPHASNFASLLPTRERSLCLGCHTAVAKTLARQFQHAPAAAGDCTQCHVPHGSKYKGLLPATQATVCRSCHEDKGRRAPSGDRKVAAAQNRAAGEAKSKAWVSVASTAVDITEVEDPWEGRPKGIDPITNTYTGTLPTGPFSHPESQTADGFECGACHEPHGSDFPGILIADVNQLCSDCHAADTGMYASSKHQGLACTDCHVLHESPDHNLLKATNPEVCVGCHDPSKGYMAHPVGGTLWDYNAGEIMTCTSTCHDPHGSANYVSLRVPYNDQGKGSDYICLICHTDVGIRY